MLQKQLTAPVTLIQSRALILVGTKQSKEEDVRQQTLSKQHMKKGTSPFVATYHEFKANPLLDSLDRDTVTKRTTIFFTVLHRSLSNQERSLYLTWLNIFLKLV